MSRPTTSTARQPKSLTCARPNCTGLRVKDRSYCVTCQQSQNRELSRRLKNRRKLANLYRPEAGK